MNKYTKRVIKRMPQKPSLVIIGEVHPHAIEQHMASHGRLKRKINESGGRKRLVADIGPGDINTKESIQRINNEILKEEVKILKKEGIARLFIEEEDSAAKREMYGRFKKSHDLKSLRSGLREEYEDYFPVNLANVRELLSGMKVWPPVMKGFDHVISTFTKERPTGIFSLAYLTVAHGAGIWDIAPVEEESCIRKANDFALLLHLLGPVEKLLKTGYSTADIEPLKKATILDSIDRNLSEIERIARERFLKLNEQRERNICRKISEEYIPGSALLCGNAHVQPIERGLAGRFEVRAYKVGEKFLDKNGQLKI